MQGDRIFYSWFGFPFIKQYLMMLFPLSKLPEISLLPSVGNNEFLAVCNIFYSSFCSYSFFHFSHLPVPKPWTFFTVCVCFENASPLIWWNGFYKVLFTSPVFCFDSIVLIFNEDLLIVLGGLRNCILCLTEFEETFVGVALLMLLLTLPLLLIVPVYFYWCAFFHLNHHLIKH